MSILPLVTGTIPKSVRNRLDFPLPVLPAIPIFSPGSENRFAKCWKISESYIQNVARTNKNQSILLLVLVVVYFCSDRHNAIQYLIALIVNCLKIIINIFLTCICWKISSFLSSIPSSKRETRLGGSRWWHCGLFKEQHSASDKTKTARTKKIGRPRWGW